MAIFMEVPSHDPQASNFVLQLPPYALHVSSYSGDFSDRAFPSAVRKQMASLNAKGVMIMTITTPFASQPRETS